MSGDNPVDLSSAAKPDSESETTEKEDVCDRQRDVKDKQKDVNDKHEDVNDKERDVNDKERDEAGSHKPVVSSMKDSANLAEPTVATPSSEDRDGSRVSAGTECDGEKNKGLNNEGNQDSNQQKVCDGEPAVADEKNVDEAKRLSAIKPGDAGSEDIQENAKMDVDECEDGSEAANTGEKMDTDV